MSLESPPDPSPETVPSSRQSDRPTPTVRGLPAYLETMGLHVLFAPGDLVVVGTRIPGRIVQTKIGAGSAEYLVEWWNSKDFHREWFDCQDVKPLSQPNPANRKVHPG